MTISQNIDINLGNNPDGFVFLRSQYILQISAISNKQGKWDYAHPG